MSSICGFPGRRHLALHLGISVLVGLSLLSSPVAAADTTVPTGSITVPEDQAVYWPGPARIYGVAADPETGISSVQGWITWFSADGPQYWHWATQTWVPGIPPADYNPPPDCITTAAGTEEWSLEGLPGQWPIGWRIEVTVRFYNGDGLIWGDSHQFFVYETVPPTGSITMPAAGGAYYPGPTAVRGTAADSGSGVGAIQCALTWNDPAGVKYWNWRNQTWVAATSDACWQAAVGSDTWQVTADMPTTWALNHTYAATARIYDACWNGLELTNTFTVRDNVPPTIASITASPSTLTNNNKLVPVTVSVVASDNAGPVASKRITGVTANEPIKGPEAGSKADWTITGDLTVKLRGTTSTTRTARVYTIHVAVTDAAGNVANGTVNVTVPAKRR